eukprot:8599188-Ditylum_brightwellii.AAC.1
MIRRKRKGKSGRVGDGDDEDEDDDRNYKERKKAKRTGNSQKANEPEIGHLGNINVPDQIWRSGLSKGER